MNTHETYVSLKVAKLLEEARFNWEVNASYWHYKGIDKFGEDKFENHGILADWNTEKYSNIVYLSAPTLAVAQRWLRDVKNIYLYAYPDFVRGSDINPVWQIKYKYKTEYWAGYYDTYEEALEAGIKKCLIIILEEKNEREEG